MKVQLLFVKGGVRSVWRRVCRAGSSVEVSGVRRGVNWRRG